MKFIVIHIIFGFLIILKCSCDEYMGRFVAWYPNIEEYKFYPKVGNCYEVYNENETVTPLICELPANPGRHSCIHVIPGEKYCLGLKTPTNETVEILCEDSEKELLSYHLDLDLKSCFNISKPDKSHQKVCQQKYDNYSIGITTPDKYTILFDSYFCLTSMSYKDKETYNNFVKTYSFDVETKSCFKIYEEYQKISPYTCFNEDVYSTCVEELPGTKNCEGIVTQNNETIVLHCSDDDNDKSASEAHNCFKIYTAENNLHISCPKRIEERCIGVTTPSNLTVLLECYFCSKPNIMYTPYDAETQRKYRKFIKTYLSNEYLGKNSYLNKLRFKGYKQNSSLEIQLQSEHTIYGYWLPNSSCYGFTLESNETVILECTSSDRKKPGCVSVINSEKVEETVCIKILDETCVGITTPLNWSVALACYPENTYIGINEYLKNKYSEEPAEEYRFYPRLNTCYEVYSSEEISPYSCRKSANPENYSCIEWLPGEKHCLGLNTPSNETIEFVCDNSTEEILSYQTLSTIKNCFNIYDSKNNSGQVCQKKFGNYGVGLTTSSNYSILFDSYFCQTFKTQEDIAKYKEFISNFTFDATIRSCYKVYTPDQDISPYTCLSNEIYDACIHPIENSGCVGITTQNNETIILKCLNDTELPNDSGCFRVYTSDNKVYSACQEQVEERCIGIVTPSNLTVLLECHTCLSAKGGSELPNYSDQYRKQYRPFVEYALYTLNQNVNGLENETTLKVYTPEQEIKHLDCYNEISEYVIHTLHGHGNCRGITLDNLETVVLECPDRIPENPGCYDVFSPVLEDNKVIGPDHKVGNVCLKILNEWCVGITTPKNWTIPLSCYQLPQAVCGVISVPPNGPPPRA